MGSAPRRPTTAARIEKDEWVLTSLDPPSSAVEAKPCATATKPHARSYFRCMFDLELFAPSALYDYSALPSGNITSRMT